MIIGCSESPCGLVSDQAGVVDIRVLVEAPGASVITAALATGGTPVQGTVNGILAPLEIAVSQPSLYVSSGGSATLTLSATVVVNGIPAPNKTVNFLLNSGTAGIAPESAITGANGVASSTVTVNHIASDVNISACVAPDNAQCRTIVIHAVAPTNMVLRQISGDGQSIKVGELFSPVSVKVEEGTGKVVTGVPITFYVDLYRVEIAPEREQRGDGIIVRREQPVLLRTFSVTAASDVNGLATLEGFAGENQPVKVVIRTIAGTAEARFGLNSAW
jgi:hypothetical protein